MLGGLVASGNSDCNSLIRLLTVIFIKGGGGG